MRNLKKGMIVFMSLFLLVSCSNDDAPEDSTPATFTLVGSWAKYKQSRLQLNNSSANPVVTKCGTYGSGFNCDIALSFYADGTGMVVQEEQAFTYSYADGIYKFNGTKYSLNEISVNEFSVVSKVTQNSIQYEITSYYTRK